MSVPSAIKTKRAQPKKIRRREATAPPDKPWFTIVTMVAVLLTVLANEVHARGKWKQSVRL